MRQLFSRFAKKARTFVRNERGAAIVLFALAAVPMVAFVGMGTDTARAYLVKSRMSSALDAAGLAGGRRFFSPTRDAEIEMFFRGNFPAGYMNATVSGPHIDVDELAERLALTAEAEIPTTLMKVIGFDKLTVSAATEITRQMQALDVVIAMDMSGSMGSTSGSTSRIGSARQAANDLVDILFGDNGSKDLLQIGLVPWNSKVNVTLNETTFNAAMTIASPVAGFTNPITGAAQSDVYTINNSPVPLLSAPPSNWRGCVFQRYIDNAADDDDADILLGPVSLTGADWPAWEPVGPEGEPVSGGVCAMSHNGTSECTPCLSHGITPLQNDKQTVVDAINDLVEPRGTTNIPEGLGWAWHVLMPGAPFDDAVADPDYELQRAIVLLTDGENVGGNGGGYKRVFGGSSAGENGMDDRLRLLATNIKSSGVVLYVIQFANNGTDLQALLQEVASGPGSPFYHYAPDDAALRAVFREIANDLSELRLSK